MNTATDIGKAIGALLIEACGIEKASAIAMACAAHIGRSRPTSEDAFERPKPARGGKKRSGRKPSRWDGPDGEAFRTAYADRAISTAAIAERFGISSAGVTYIAKRLGLPMRGKFGGKPREAGKKGKKAVMARAADRRDSQLDVVQQPKPSKPSWGGRRAMPIAGGMGGTDTAALVDEHIARNGAPPVYEPGASGDRWSIGFYLREHGHEVENVSATRKGWLKIDGKILEREAVFALVNRYRADEGKVAL